MALANLHPKNERRLATLRNYYILDTESEIEFDEMVGLASQICETPISLMSLVDSDRQWFKARKGFEDPETGLEKSVCAHSIIQDEFFEIEDLTKDQRTIDNPLVLQDQGIRFYAGSNLVAPNGMPVGTLCVLDTVPRVLTDLQRNTLVVLARQIVSQMELRSRLRTEKILRSEIDHRVKNSLQTLSSVVRMSSKTVDDPAALNVISMIERHIDSVGSLHTELMLHDEGGLLSAGAYLSRVGSLLQQAAPNNIRITTESDEVILDERKASAIGMIVSEFVANSIKHAFPGDCPGRVRLSIRSLDRKTAILDCTDDGGGHRPVKHEPAGNTGLGKKLMGAAVAQLRGSLDQSSDAKGTTLRLTFAAD